MARTKTPDVEVFIHMTLINGKFDIEYNATPDRFALVTHALSMATSRVFDAWMATEPGCVECGVAAMKDWRKKQIAKRAGGSP